jgi:hypothetical protein
MVGYYALDCIGKISCSIDINSSSNPDSEIAKAAIDIFAPMNQVLLCQNLPSLAKFFNISFMNKKTVAYFLGLVKAVIKQREDNPKAKFNDVISIMLKVRDGQIKSQADDFNGDGEAPQKVEMTDKIIALTLNQFFLDGYSTVSNLIADSLCFLALYPEVQVDNSTNYQFQLLCVNYQTDIFRIQPMLRSWIMPLNMEIK